MPIDFRSQRQATFEQGTTDPTWGFDSLSSGWISAETGHSSYPQKLGYGERDLTTATSEDYARAQTYGSFSTKPHGKIDVNWRNKNEVWYGAAFFLPSNFQTSHGNIDILRWDSSGGQDFGGIGLRTSDNKFHLVGGASPVWVATSATRASTCRPVAGSGSRCTRSSVASATLP